ncbi:MAG: DNA double-strand break repair nuclease NurA [Armatimonas sp.]
MLDLSDLTSQVATTMGRWEAREARRVAACDALLALAAQPTDPALRQRKAGFLAAHPEDNGPVATTYPAPETLEKYIVVATDGSQVVPDRHDGFEGIGLIHTGRVRIVYGTGERARLDAIAEVFFDDDDDDTEPGSAGRLALRRMAAEFEILAELAEEARQSALPAIALTDGSLIAWMLSDRGREDQADPHQRATREVLLASLERCRQAGVPIVGYVSGPGSRDVVNGLRLVDNSPDVGLTDARLFARLLKPGERSPLCSAKGRVDGYPHILKEYAEHWVGFFYLNVGAELARIELPLWAAESHLETIHALCLDQARKGRGYPVALAEAHERAVVRGPDREAFLRLLTRNAVKTGIASTLTRKALAKRARTV